MARTNKQQSPPTGYKAEFLDSCDFDKADYQRRWLVNSILVDGQPGVIGGAKKTLKTSLALDMAISLATGTSFLGKFRVPACVRVAVLSGESGEATFQETARRICKAKKVKLRKNCEVLWSFDLPQLTQKADLAKLRTFLESEEVKVVFLDPLYLCLLDGGNAAAASNLFETGPLLRRAARTCLEAGATPIFIHHTTKGAANPNPKRVTPLDLNALAFSGIAEFARQWVLLSRCAPFEPGSGKHALLMTVGGSAGHSGCCEVAINEGTLREDFSGRTWDVVVRPLSSAGSW